MTTPDDAALAISSEDLEQHVVKYGLDVFPPLDMRTETTHAQDLFSSLREDLPELYQELSFAPDRNEFRIGATFTGKGGMTKYPTLVFTQKGPVFAFPCLFPDPIGRCTHKAELDDIFWQSFGLLRKNFPTVEVLRLGLINEAVFNTGKTNFVPYLAKRFGSFPGATLVGGRATLSFRDELCNVRVQLQTIEIHRQARAPATQHVVSQEMDFGVQVTLDVNNIEMKRQGESDIQSTLERAHSLWPKALLEFINA